MNRWTPDEVIGAFQKWYRVHGKTPTILDWDSGTDEYPSRRIVLVRLGGWNKGLQAAGLPIRPSRGGHRKRLASTSGPV